MKTEHACETDIDPRLAGRRKHVKESDAMMSDKEFAELELRATIVPAAM